MGKTAFELVHDLVVEEQQLAQRLCQVRAALEAVKKLGRVQTSTRRPSNSGPAPAAASSAARPVGRKATRARRPPRRARPPAPSAPEERPVRTEAIARAARGKAIRELLAQARPAPIAPTPAPAQPPPSPPPVAPAETTSTTTKPHRQKAAERADRIRKELGDKLPWKRPRGEKAADGGRGERVPYSARAGQTETFCRCKLAVPIETSAANQQARAMASCGALVFSKKLHQHLAQVHNLEVGADHAAEYFDLVEHQGGGG